MWLTAVEMTTLANKICYYQGRLGQRKVLKLSLVSLGVSTGEKSNESSCSSNLYGLLKMRFSFFPLRFLTGFLIALHISRCIVTKSFSLQLRTGLLMKT